MHLDDAIAQTCPVCGWYTCPSCGACGCNREDAELIEYAQDALIATPETRPSQPDVSGVFVVTLQAPEPAQPSQHVIGDMSDIAIIIPNSVIENLDYWDSIEGA